MMKQSEPKEARRVLAAFREGRKLRKEFMEELTANSAKTIPVQHIERCRSDVMDAIKWAALLSCIVLLVFAMLHYSQAAWHREGVVSTYVRHAPPVVLRDEVVREVDSRNLGRADMEIVDRALGRSG